MHQLTATDHKADSPKFLMQFHCYVQPDKAPLRASTHPVAPDITENFNTHLSPFRQSLYAQSRSNNETQYQYISL